MNEVPL